MKVEIEITACDPNKENLLNWVERNMVLLGVPGNQSKDDPCYAKFYLDLFEALATMRDQLRLTLCEFIHCERHLICMGYMDYPSCNSVRELETKLLALLEGGK